ncbi:SusC/RagA family TonB-linked outer membrane protein [Sphingobacterium lumbrici]|uniref:SusC/RagA family TonB-linked outer membrane protein n=1 Tax=Sphingobacterium lumbrici TaxID=2559600 RepID=UPI00112A5198|nr:SusC/RagA family TonB-linked outer membrane protein [Sphingobacterium lumbrici]
MNLYFHAKESVALSGKPQRSFGELFRVLIIMKLITILILVFSFQVTANVKAQQISMSVKNVSLEKVIKEFRRQSDYAFLYNSSFLKKAHLITADFKNESVDEALTILFRHQPFIYSIVDKTITIVPKKDEAKIKAAELQQQEKINGRVLDNNGVSLAGVTVKLDNSFTGNVSVTNNNGLFSIAVQKGDVLLFSFLGFKTQKVIVKDFSEIIVKLEKDQLTTEEVVVTGIFNKRMSTFTGSASTITGDQLRSAGTRNILQSIHNIDPTMNIIESNVFGSNPNKLPEIQIRGTNSVPNVNELKDMTNVALNTPLVIIDGFEASLQRLMDMNENEIDMVTILRDASATAIYGSRGANGVIVITLKAPMPGKLRISYRSDVSVEAADLTAYNLLHAKDKLLLEDRVGLYRRPNNPEADWHLQRYYSYLMNEVNSGVDTYWLSKPLQVGVGHKQNLRLEGGDEVFRYSGSVQYNEIKGAMKGSSRDTWNGSLGFSYFMNKVKFSNNFMLTSNNQQESQYGEFRTYASMNPYWRTHDLNGNVLKYLGNSGEYDYIYRWGQLPVNPLYNTTLNAFDKGNGLAINNNFMMDYSIMNNLNMRARLGVTKNISETDVFKPADHTDFAGYAEEDMYRKGSYAYGLTKTFGMEGSINLSYNKSIGKNVISAGLDYNIRTSKYSGLGVKAEGFLNERLDDISNAMQYQQNGRPSGGESETRAIGMTSTVNYSYDNRFFMDLSGRIDGSSQFGSKRRFAPFWSTGIGWNIHNESIMKELDWLDQLKVRGSVGTTGSQNFRAYQAIPTYKYFLNDRYYNSNASYLMALGNENLQWQQKRDINLGLDAKFLGFVSVNLDLYRAKTERLISSATSPAANGFTYYIENIGSLQNTGFELKMSFQVVNNPNLYWSISTASIHNKNKMLELSPALLNAQKALESTDQVNPNKQYIPGYSSNTIWAVKSAGINPADGREVFINRFGERTLVWNGNDVVSTGVNEPQIEGNVSTLLRYKKLTLNASFGYRIGADVYNSTLASKVEVGREAIRWNVDSRVYYERWKNVGDQAMFKGLDDFTPTNKTSRFVQKENLFKCQNITVQYNIKPKFLTNLGMDYCVVAASTSDVFYISTIKQERGISYPFARQFSLNFNLVF